MDSIIAQQKVGKRRPVRHVAPSETTYRYRLAADAEPRSLKLYDSAAKVRAGRARFRIREAIRSIARKALGLRKTDARSRARLAIAACAAFALFLGMTTGIAAIVRGPAFPLPKSGLVLADDSAKELLLDYVSPELLDGKPDADTDTALPPAPVTLELSTYTVRPGDSLPSIAKRFGLYVDTLISANGISSASAVRPGTQLRIPNINGLIHKVRAGDNLGSISKRYKTDTTRIVDANDLGSASLRVGMSLFIPGARLPEADLKQALGQKVAWPLRGSLSSYFGYRPDPFTGVIRFHAGIDIVANSGTPVRAAMDGVVSDVGYNGNYGNYVILSHGGGFQTLYGHLTAASVAKGSTVTQGSVIGISGNTGYSTGPHLHFGLFRKSLPLNPLKYLKS